MIPFILEEIFKSIGRDMKDYLEIMIMDPFYQLVFAEGKKLKTSYDADKFKNSISSINPEDVKDYNRYMKDNQKKIRHTLPVLQ